jgi:ADP-ribosylglycohydrolase
MVARAKSAAGVAARPGDHLTMPAVRGSMSGHKPFCVLERGSPVHRGGLADRILAVLIGALVGDAMGAPTEGLEADEIECRHGWVADFAGSGTDDSLMASLLIEALVLSGGHASLDEWAVQIAAGHELIHAQRQNFFPSVLHLVEKLRSGVPPRAAALGNLPSSSSAMCFWPVGVINAGQPARAALQAYRLAALIHTYPVDFCQDGSAFIAAAVAAGMKDGSGIWDSCAAGLRHLDSASGEIMRAAITAAVRLAEQASDYRDFRARYHASGRQRVACDARETVPAAAGLACLAGGDIRVAVEYGANFGRDTDTIAAMTGALCGAVNPSSLPEVWLRQLGAAEVQSARATAERLAATARALGEQTLADVAAVADLAAPLPRAVP